MIKGKYGQAKCSYCEGWHFAISLDENLNPIEFKCCRCKKITKYKPKLKVLKEEIKTTSSVVPKINNAITSDGNDITKKL